MRAMRRWCIYVGMLARLGLTHQGEVYLYRYQVGSTLGSLSPACRGQHYTLLEKPASRFIRESQEAWRGGLNYRHTLERSSQRLGAQRSNLPHYPVGQAVLISEVEVTRQHFREFDNIEDWGIAG